MYEKIVEKLVEWIRQDEGLFDPASYPLKGRKTNGEIILKNDNVVLSGVEIIKELSKHFNLAVVFYFKDGEVVSQGTIAKIQGEAYDVLITERTFLNILSLMSSTATKVKNMVEIVKSKNCQTKIAATRKTLPLAGELQKLAIIHGGGDTHRLNLSETVMIKDNHKKIYGSISKAVEEVKKIIPFTKKIEVEAESEEEAFEGLRVGADIIMLDNFTPEKAKELAKMLKKERDIIIEISGGISEENIVEYLSEDIDVISIGRLTSEIKYLDFSLEIV